MGYPPSVAPLASDGKVSKSGHDARPRDAQHLAWPRPRRDFYADPEKAVAELRRDGPRTEGPARTGDGVLHLPCPPGLKCKLVTERFDVPGIEGAVGINTTQTIKDQAGSLHPAVLRADAVGFRDEAIVEQVFQSTERPSERRAALIDLAQELYRQGS
jgi:hypothetical protein